MKCTFTKFALVAAVALSVIAATLVKKVSEFPSVTTPGTDDLFLLALASTNNSIKYSDLKSSINATNLTLSVNATNVTTPNIADTATVTWSKSGSNLTATAAGGDASAPVNNFYATNTFFVSGKGNILVVTQTINVSGHYVYPLAAGTGITFTTNTLGSGQTNLTIASTATGGDTTGTNIVSLTQSGTNVAQLDFALIQNGGLFKLSATNNCYISAPANVSSGIFRKAWLMVQQPSTGTCLITWTNGFFCAPYGQTLVNDTNNGSVTVYELVSDPFTNGLVHVSMTALSKLMP